MANEDGTVGRAGMHLKHFKDPGERSPALHEMMREIVPGAVDYWAERNPSIVVADEQFDIAMVNDGQGGFRACSNVDEVLTYGAARLSRLEGGVVPDKPMWSKKKGIEEMRGGTITTSLIVAHLPKSMCVEIKDFYPVLDWKTGKPVMKKDGTPLRRSRWVARDKDEARRYFEDLVDILSETMIPGGKDAVLGYDIQFSETTPHVQIMADTLAEIPDREDGALRAETSRAYFEHRHVKDERGKTKSGKRKLSEYHATLKAQLIARGYDISPDFDEKRHLTGQGKDEYVASQTMLAEAEADREYVDKQKEVAEVASAQAMNAFASIRAQEDGIIAAARAKAQRIEDAAVIDAQQRSAALDAREADLDAALEAIPKMRAAAVAEGRAEGRAEVEAERRAATQERAGAAEKARRAEEAQHAAQASLRAAQAREEEAEKAIADARRVAETALALPDGRKTFQDGYNAASAAALQLLRERSPKLLDPMRERLRTAAQKDAPAFARESRTRRQKVADQIADLDARRARRPRPDAPEIG